MDGVQELAVRVKLCHLYGQLLLMREKAERGLPVLENLRHAEKLAGSFVQIEDLAAALSNERRVRLEALPLNSADQEFLRLAGIRP